MLDSYLPLKVIAEQKKYCDLVQFDFIDHYNNITLKTVHIVKYLLDHPIISRSAEYVLFTDDDSYVNVPKLHEELFIKKVSIYLKKHILNVLEKRST